MKSTLLCIVGLLFIVFSTKAWALNIDNGTISVGSGDILPEQIDDVREGFNFRFAYKPNNTNTDGSHGKYYTNNSSLPSYYGYMSAVYEQSGTNVYLASYYPIIPTAINTESWVIWHFDFSSAGTDYSIIDQLQVKMRSNVANYAGSWLKWQISTDNQNWNEVFSLSANQFNAAFWNLTEYVQGSSEYFLKATLFSTKYCDNASLFRQSDFGFDNEVWLIPEPLTAMMLVIGVACVLRGRKQGR